MGHMTYKGHSSLSPSPFPFDDDHPFIVLPETKFSIRCIPVWARGCGVRGPIWCLNLVSVSKHGSEPSSLSRRSRPAASTAIPGPRGRCCLLGGVSAIASLSVVVASVLIQLLF